MPSRKKKIKTVLYLYEDQLRRLRKIAAKRDEPISLIVRKGVDMVIKKLS